MPTTWLLGLPQNSGQAPLTDKNLERYTNERDKRRNKLQDSDQCRKFLVALGIDPDAAFDAVSRQRDFDGAPQVSRLLKSRGLCRSTELWIPVPEHLLKFVIQCLRSNLQ
jgi:hypothetical protein